MKKLLLCASILLCSLALYAQVTTVTSDYKIINIGGNGYGDYTRALILLHEMYNGTNLGTNYAIGTITAKRGTSGSFNRINVAEIKTSSAYQNTSATMGSFDSYSIWALKTCIYNGKRYLAVDIPYSDASHDQGYYFAGWTTSTGESMKCVAYLNGGSPVNQSILSNIEDYASDMSEYHSSAGYYISGSTGIGTTDTKGYKFAVNGAAIATSMKVKLQANWPDYVFKKDYKLPTLTEVKDYIDKNQHLPDMPSAEEVHTNGLDLGEMNRLLLKKVEELTLYIIQQKDANEKALKVQQSQINQMKKRISNLTPAK